MRFLVAIILLINVSNAGEQVKVQAESFEADERRNISVFQGNVHLSKGDDSLKADLVTIYFDKKNHPLRYEAKGDVNFKVSVDKKSLYQGKSTTLVFKPSENIYELLGNVVVEDVRSERKLIGNKIILNLKNGHAMVIGKKKKPVIMTFVLDEDKNLE